MQEYLEEDLGLSHLPVIVSAEHGLCNPLTGSPQVLLMGEREILMSHLTFTLKRGAFLYAGFLSSSILPVLPPPSWRIFHSLQMHLEETSVQREVVFSAGAFLQDGNNLLIKCLYWLVSWCDGMLLLHHYRTPKEREREREENTTCRSPRTTECWWIVGKTARWTNKVSHVWCCLIGSSH